MTDEEVAAAKVVSQLMGGVTKEVEETSEPGEPLRKKKKKHPQSERGTRFLCTPVLFSSLPRGVLGCSGRKRRVPDLHSPAEHCQDTAAVCHLQQHWEAHRKMVTSVNIYIKKKKILKCWCTNISSGFGFETF